MSQQFFRPTRGNFLCLFLLAFSFLLMTLRWTPTVRSFRALLFYCLSPAYEVPFAVEKGGTNLASRIRELIQTHQENQNLKERIKEVSALESQWRETQAENERLRRLLELRSALPFRLTPALVAGRDAQSWTHSILIDRGTENGVRLQSPVLAVGKGNGENSFLSGVIGRVLECGPHLSKVLLITDPLSSVAVTLPRTGEQGLAQGQGGLSVTVDYLDRSAEVLVGEEVRTSGLGGVFPAGLAVGKITKIVPSTSEFKRAILQPSVSLTELREVLVLEKSP
ncbi:MAG: rod shape-determining protein MreC [Elusimicrobia bacterium]|nr:rod shape-determining protein MreC [Elusimicrobiota bacterium]